MSTIPITLTGTIATAPQPRTLPTGRACASFRLAVNHWRVDKSTGEFTNDSTSWFGVDCYGPLASNSATSLHTGMSIIVTGSLKIREWETADKSGNSPTVVAEHIGPDLRYGTANYLRARGSEREQSPSNATTPGGSGQSGSGWGGMDAADPVGAPPVGTGMDEELTDAEDCSSYPGDDRPDAEDSTAADDLQARTSSSEVSAAGDDDIDMIARDTAAAASPF